MALDTPDSGSGEAGGLDIDSEVAMAANLDLAAALTELGADGEAPDVEEVFALHMERVAAVHLEAERLMPLLEQQQSNLKLVKEIQAIDGAGHEDALARDFEVIAAAIAWQATTLGVSMEVVEPHGHALPSEAAFALAERHDVQVDEHEREELSSLDALPVEQRDALTGVINGFLAFEDATHQAFEGADVDWLLEQIEQSEALSDLDSMELLALLEDEGDLMGPGHDLIEEAGFQVGLILGTRTQFLSSVMDFQRVWEDFSLPASQGSADQGPEFDLCPALAMDLQGVDTSYEDNCALVLDVGGDDVFLNNAGGSKLVGEPDECLVSASVKAAAAVVNLEGSDQYISDGRCGVNGGGHLGVGFLYDAGGGNDTYTAGNWGTNGGGWEFGVGFLYDAGGDNDTYTAGNEGTNGGGDVGVGFLYDAGGGNDTYTAGDGGNEWRRLGVWCRFLV